MAGPVAGHGWRAAAAWSGVVALNLVVPVPLAALVLANEAAVGTGAAIVLLWAAGLVVCLQSPRLRTVLIRGGAVVALTQLCPALQVMAGVLAYWFWVHVGEDTLGSGFVPRALQGFVMAVVTAGPLSVAAFTFGGGFRLLRAAPATEQAADFGDAVWPAAEN